jgi:ABC-2 type transporter
LLADQLPVFFKQRDNLFFRAWQFHLPRAILSVPQALIEAMVWSIITYWLVGFAPNSGR